MAEPLLAAQCRFRRKDGREAAVVAADVPSHKRDLGARDSLRDERIDDLAHLVEGHGHLHRRFVLECLVLHSARHWLPALPYADFRIVHGIFQQRAVLDLFLQGLKPALRKPDLPVQPADAGVGRILAFELIETEHPVAVVGLVVERSQRKHLSVLPAAADYRDVAVEAVVRKVCHPGLAFLDAPRNRHRVAVPQ